MTDYHVYTLDQRPELREQGDAVARRGWFPFMYHHKINKPDWHRLYAEFAAYQFVICTADDTVVAVSNNIPLAWSGERETMPKGWDAAYAQAMQNYDAGVSPTVLNAVSVAVDPTIRQRGLGTRLLVEMKNIAQKHGLDLGLIATVRPTQKSRYPLIPMEAYIHWRKADGTYYDAWLATHIALGGIMLDILPYSKYIEADALWEQWTGLYMPHNGDYVIPDALVPLLVRDKMGIYVEPNVWFHHRL